ncbi:NAD(P)-binding domain-containing protein [Pseudomonas putida]|uniref:NAD(P)-binding domain-containing protein n=1 Tax=Pseudomonas putida TaxID=303 RepID=UPI003CC7C7CE
MSGHAHSEPVKAAAIGLGTKGLGIAKPYLRPGFNVTGYDVSEAAREWLRTSGEAPSTPPREVVTGAPVFTSVVMSARQSEQILLGDSGPIQAMPKESVFISSATMPPTEAKSLVTKAKERGVPFFDVPVSGGAKRSASGDTCPSWRQSSRLLSRNQPQWHST